MSFHLTMLLVVIFVALGMHAMANAADAPQPALTSLSAPEFGAR